MEPNERVLSDIHVGKMSTDSGNLSNITRFKFNFCLEKSTPECCPPIDLEVDCNEAYDSDPDIPRRHQDWKAVNWDFIVNIEHAMSTTLEMVGCQVWQGSLLLADWLISHQDQIRNSLVLDLGTGTGLTSIIAGLFARRVYATDVGKDVLNLCLHNIVTNCDQLPIGTDTILVRELDWLWFSDDQHVSSSIGALFKLKSSHSPTDFCFSSQEVEDILLNLNWIIASDIAYQKEGISAFFALIDRLMTHRLKAGQLSVLIIAIERRFIFSLEEKNVTCKEYDHFMSCLNNLSNKSPSSFKVDSICPDIIPKCILEYSRESQLSLFQVSAVLDNICN